MENETKKTKAIIPAIRNYELAKPGQMKMMASVLKDYIRKNDLSVTIANRQYVMVEGWQFAGGLMGLNPRIVDVKELGANRWMAQAEIVDKTGRVVATGYALCSKSEGKKASFDEYAILSMAQTRAIGKAYRNLVGWVVKMAGFEATPAEESGSLNQQQKEASAKPSMSPTIENTIASIRRTGDIQTLKNTLNKIRLSTTYKDVQKRLITQAIKDRLDELNGSGLPTICQ